MMEYKSEQIDEWNGSMERWINGWIDGWISE